MKPWILIIDDDEDFRECAIEVFQMEGYRVSSAKNGVDAFKILEKAGTGPALILLDLWMPEMNGAEFLMNLEQELPILYGSVPVILCSASEPELMGRYRDRYPFLAKPAQIDQIVSQARSMIQQNQCAVS